MIWLWQAFVVSLLFLCWGFVLVIWGRGGGNLASYETLRIMAYTMPGFVAFAFRWIVEHRGFRRSFGELGLAWGRWAFWPLSYLLPLGLVLVIYALGLLTGVAHFDPSLAGLARDMQAAGKPVPAELWGLFWSNLGVSLSLGVLLFLPVALLDEMGSRAYLLDVLSERFGPKATLIIAGAVWSLAYAPFLFLRNPYGSLWGVPIYILFAWGWGVVLSWLYIKSRTVLVPGVAFLVLDVLDGSLAYLFPGNPLLAGAEGLLGAVIMLGLGVGVIFTAHEIYTPPKKAKA